MQILGIDHVVLRVADLGRAIAFYERVLGCTVERRQDDLGLVQLRAGSALIDLVAVAGVLGRRGGAAPGPEGRNMDHLCLRVAAFDPEAEQRRLEALGIAVESPASRYGSGGEGLSFYISDPDGNHVELRG